MKRTWSLGIVLLGLACVGPTSPSAETAAQDGWLADVERHLVEREYHASATRRGLQAPNRRHNLRTYFSPDGILVVDRTAEGSPELLALSLAGFGREGSQHEVIPGEVSHREGRVEIAHGDAIVEWYENGPDGLEQGFTLPARPPGTGPLDLEVAVASAAVSTAGDGLEFQTEAGRRLRYAKLHVEDARGETLAAHFATSDAGFRISVDDTGASYPIVVDPLLTESFDHEVESNQIDANLGISVASAGDVNGDGYADIIVGSYFYDSGQSDEGAAFIFHGSAGGIGDGNPLNANTFLEANQASSRFGFSCASAGDVDGDGYDDVIVGAYLYEIIQSNEGNAFLFHGGPTGIADGDPSTANARLEGDQSNAVFGRSVASAGDVNGDGYADVIVGADDYDAGQGDEGAAFVFHGSATGVGTRGAGAADAQLESNQANAFFGRSVASAGDVNGDGYTDVIVGAHLYDASLTDEGAAFIFHGSATGIPDGSPATADTELEGDQGGARFGFSVAGAGDVDGDGYGDVIVGAYLRTGGLGTLPDEGFAYVFLGSASGVADTTANLADTELESKQDDAHMGYSVASAGDVNGDGYADVIVGAQSYTNGEATEGAAFVFLGRAGGIPDGDPTDAYAQLETDQVDARLGRSVASAGDVNGDGYDDVIVGAPFFDGPQSGEGQAFVYHGGASGIAGGSALSAHAQLESNQASGSFGRSVASAGDVNGDGYADVIVGANLYDSGEVAEGAAFVFLGSPDGIPDGSPSTVHAQLESDETGASFGWSVGSAGDVNQDGYADVIVGAISYGGEGAAFIFHGSAAGLADGDPDSANAQLDSGQASSTLGVSVASAGDVNGDGFADVIVGAESYDANEINEGAAFIFHGGPGGVGDGSPLTADAQLESNQAGANLGSSCASAGDVNGDGYADVIVGAPDYDDPEADEGAAFIFLGGPSGVADGNPSTAHAQLESDETLAHLGASVASAGDVNGDGYADVIVGAWGYDSGLPANAGAAFIFHGSTTGIANGTPLSADAEITGDQAAGLLGWSVASAGDVDADGHGDVIVGAFEYNLGHGTAFLFHGSATGVASASVSAADAQIDSTQPSSALGISVASAGDVNGDGFGDVIVGAYRHDNGEMDEGAAFVFLGNSEGRPTRTQQRRADASGVPVAPGGVSFATGGFQAEMIATSPRGRERGKLEIEACPSGTPFGDPGCTLQTSAAWVDLGTGGALLVEDLTGLPGGPLYDWRARVLTVPFFATEPGITPVPRPGPWRRFQARATPGDIRLPEPGLHAGLAAGLLLLAALRRRRRS